VNIDQCFIANDKARAWEALEKVREIIVVQKKHGFDDQLSLTKDEVNFSLNYDIMDNAIVLQMNILRGELEKLDVIVNLSQ
jgi:hypothetical protein